MIEKTKLSLWDFFVSLLSGLAVILSILVHCLFKKVITWEMILGLPTAFLITVGIPTIILIGLLFEPIANSLTKIFITCPCKYRGKLGFKKWQNDIDAIEKSACQYIPDELHKSVFQYCKNYLCQNNLEECYMPFLAKFGFYRSVSVLALLNALIIPFMYRFDGIEIIMTFIAITVLALIYWHRSEVFYRHISSTVYSLFIAFNREKNKPRNKEA